MIKLYRYLTIHPEFHREKEFNAANKTRKLMVPHAPNPISEEGYFLTNEALAAHDRAIFERGFEAARENETWNLVAPSYGMKYPTASEAWAVFSLEGKR